MRDKFVIGVTAARAIVGLLCISCCSGTLLLSSFCPPTTQTRRANTCLNARNEKRKKSKEITLGELMDEMERNPSKFQPQLQTTKSKKRTRKRVDNPKQTYVYKSQRKQKGQQKDGAAKVEDENNPIQQARTLGLANAAAQHSDALITDVEPEIVGQLRVGEDDATTSGSMAYVINKPVGWSILGGTVTKKKKEKTSKQQEHDDSPQDEYSTRLKVKDDDGTMGVVEFNEMDILAAMTPEERAEFEAEGGLSELLGAKQHEETIVPHPDRSDGEEASFDAPARPSAVSWLKDLQEEQGSPIRGGKYWTAIAGATNVDDTGLVVICPKDKVDNLYIDYAKYVAVVGNGKCFTPKAKTKDAPPFPKELIKMELMSKLRKGRGDDTVHTVALTFLEKPSSCTSVVQPCQAQFSDGIRGDPIANPLDRRAPRRLVHCDSISVSSLVHDDTVQARTVALPDDIHVLADRRNHHEYKNGSFLGRSELKENSLTTAYREINGAGDGFPGWTVDRYDKWLLVQHDDKTTKGPLPSIHDGNTAGVYYLPANPNRSSMGSRTDARPTLLEGQAAPDVLSVSENDITYHVSLERDLSTGIFLDQRPQRAWLSKNCNSATRLLNCFAHCGAFSVAAAVAGASTVSLDLQKKWLDRIEPQMRANGIGFDKHDCIYGDCFDWLARLSKRGELYDIVILDPPSTSVGKKKKRWSIKNDMADLVTLAAPLVKRGGLLWTTTNSASIPVFKFARMCKKGLDSAGLPGAKLERVVPMPTDFPCVGPQPVKNLVWRLP